MKRAATSASRCLERISSTTPTAYSTTARQSRKSRSEIKTPAASSQQSRRLSIPARPATATTTTRPSTTKLRTPAQRPYSSTQALRADTPPESSHFLREDTNALSPAASKPKTHYALFPKSLPHGPPPHGPFTISLPSLKREFLQLQAVAHPDRHSGVNKLRAEATSSAINEAYRTLEDPLRRANYLLELKGWETEECDKMGGEFMVPGHGSLHPAEDAGMGESQDMELLMEVMEAREAVEEAESEEEVAALKVENEERIADSIKVLEEAFAKDDLAAAKRESVRLRYWRNIGESLREWEGKGSQHVLNH